MGFGTLLVTSELATVTATSTSGAIAVETAIDLLVTNGWTVTMSISLVVDDLFAAIGQEHVVTANSQITITLFHVSEIIAGFVVLHVVFKFVFSWSVLFLAAITAVAAAIAAITALLPGEDGTGQSWSAILRAGSSWSTVL